MAAEPTLAPQAAGAGSYVNRALFLLLIGLTWATLFAIAVHGA